eukprot:Seg1309.3 transcript_id=Seg1309.3/GoldUCD/mRNA.D3Y31 product="hypothetical protein" protein_id=Seg1309.3/GoldUCD/D3Y31
MEQVEKAKKKRKTHRGLVTKQLNKVNNYLNQESTEIDNRRVKQFQEDLSNKFEYLKLLDAEILEGLFENEIEEDLCDKEAEESEEIRERVSFSLICLKETLESGNDNASSRKSDTAIQRSVSRESLNSVANSEAESVPESEASARSNQSNNSLFGNGKRVRVTLPKLELKKFSGKIHEWQEFWDSFRSAIHEDEDIAKVDKFKYLRSFLEEPARGVITGFALTDADYDSAVDLLRSRKRFARPSVIRHAHINEMANLSPVFNEKSIGRLRNFHDQIEAHYRGLEALGVDKQSYSSIVVPLLMPKLPDSVRMNMIDLEKIIWNGHWMK